MKTAEEVSHLIAKRLCDNHNTITPDMRIHIRNVMEEEIYSQFHPSPEIPELSDEEIEKWAKKKPQIFQHDEPLSIELGKEVFASIIKSRIEGAKWYRTKLREGGKKDE